ncbi:MAG TPA: hypothetical protein VMF50_15220 [Candidatus Binataceae bacterium]|nr:hypothetical protein [Candidatus Binataceae bacterium]
MRPLLRPVLVRVLFVPAALAIAMLSMVLWMAACTQAENSLFGDKVSSTLSNISSASFGGDSGLTVHSVRSSRQVIIHKIAVMPVIDDPDQVDKTLPEDAAGAVTAELYAKANITGGWEVVPEDDVEDAMQQLPPTTPANMDQNALELGRKVAADGVLYGTVNRYRERVGYEYAAQTPAAVAFSLDFVDENSKQIVWSAKFAKEQKALTENIFDLPNFLSNKARWVRAQDIASEGCQAAINNLYSRVNVQPILQGK